MFVLRVRTGPYKGQVAEISSGTALVIGRDPDAHLVLDDARVSGKHACVDWDEGGFSIVDLQSGNGTLVNGRQIKARASLEIGDHIQVGSVLMELAEVDVEVEDVDLIESESQGGMLSLQSAATAIISRGSVVSVRRAPVLATTGHQTLMHGRITKARLDDATLSRAARLKQLVDEGGTAGTRVIALRDGRRDPFATLPVTIGREQSSGIVLDDDAISLRHALIEERAGEWRVRDLGSSNGTFVNGERVVERALVEGDVISLGKHALLIVMGRSALGVDVQTPSMVSETSDLAPVDPGSILHAQTLQPAKRPKKRAADLIWYATSDLDRGVFRARSAAIALLLGTLLTVWMLARGDSQVLAGDRLSTAHESPAFVSHARSFERDRCTACHVGGGQTSTLLCLDCHDDRRPSDAHARADVLCRDCHREHLGPEYPSAATAQLSCMDTCHPHPHEVLERTRPQLIIGFTRAATADVDFHLTHESQGVQCLTCHAKAVAARPGAERSACAQCHAPANPGREDCQRCHGSHPEPAQTSTVFAARDLVAPVDPPRFAARAIPWALSLMILAFIVAAMLPRERKVAMHE